MEDKRLEEIKAMLDWGDLYDEETELIQELIFMYENTKSELLSRTKKLEEILIENKKLKEIVK